MRQKRRREVLEDSAVVEVAPAAASAEQVVEAEPDDEPGITKARSPSRRALDLHRHIYIYMYVYDIYVLYMIYLYEIRI